MEIRKVGVVGTGTMGTQIGIVSARGGFDRRKVKPVDRKAERFRDRNSLLAASCQKVLRCLETFQRELGEKYRPSPLLVKLVKAERLGRKSGRGIYDYRTSSFASPLETVS